jgi:hypothetical protein
MHETNNLDWKTYESITKYIYETLGKEYRVTIEGHGASCNVTGASGAKHQIDVLTVTTASDNSYRTAIECKYWNKKVDRDVVMKLVMVMQDTQIEKGIIVTKSGYTKDALEFARYHNIELVVLREFDEKDAETEPRKMMVGTLILRPHVFISRPEVLKIDVEYTDNSQKKIPIYSLFGFGYTVAFTDGKKIAFRECVAAFQEILRDGDAADKVMTKRLVFKDATFIHDKSGASAKINAVKFTGTLRKLEEHPVKEYSIEDNVVMIMRNIFEERRFSVWRVGLLWSRNDIIEHSSISFGFLF